MFYRIPPLPQFSIPRSMIVAPDSSLIYAHFSHICWFQLTEALQLFNSRSKIWSIDCSPDWSTRKLVAIICEDRNVWIWDLEKRAVIKGHNVHTDKSKESSDYDNPWLALCYTHDKKVITTDPRRLVLYDVAANKYKIYMDMFKKEKVSVLSASPYNPDIFAAGTQKGHVWIYNLKRMELVVKLSPFNKMIWSLDWIDSEMPTSFQQEDLFDVNNANANDEFGTTGSVKDQSKRNKENDVLKPTYNELFDYDEECLSLKTCITNSKNDQVLDEVEMAEVDTNPTIEQCQQNVEMKDLARSSSMGSEGEAESLDADAMEMDSNEEDSILLLVSSTENSFSIWSLRGKYVNGTEFTKKPGFSCRNFVARWINTERFIANISNGEVMVYQGDANPLYKKPFRVDNENKGLFNNQKAVLDIAVDRKRYGIVWTVSFHHKIMCTSINRADGIHYEISTSPMRVDTIVPSSIDPYLFAIGSQKRISFLNVSQGDKRNFSMQHCDAKIFAQVLSLAWHPVDENLLAFSVKDGRVGIVDTKRLNEVKMFKTISAKDVYCVTWLKKQGREKYDLYCCTDGKLMRYLEGKVEVTAMEVNPFRDVSCISANKQYLAIGTSKGGLNVCNLDKALTYAYTKDLYQKLICSMDWKDNMLVVTAYQNNFTVFNLTDRNNVTEVNFEGHEGVVYCARWNQFVDNRLATGSQDNTVRIWDTAENTCLHTISFEQKIYTVVFHPIMEYHVIVGGYDFPVSICDYREAIDLKEPNTKSRKPRAAFDYKPGILDHDNAQARIMTEKKKNRRLKTIVTDNVEETVEKLTIEDNEYLPKAATNKKPLQFNYTTFLCLTNKELNRDPLATMQKILRDRMKGVKEVRHDQLLSKDPELHRKVLAEEYLNHQVSGTDSVGNLALPMLTSTLKEVILEKIESKSLSEEYIALAPTVSYTFWKNCCAAFAAQCVEKHELLRSVNYFIIADQPQQAIDVLCEGRHFAEAVAVAQTRRPAAVEKIVEKWIEDLDSNGNYEAAAIVLMAAEKYSAAVAFLERRKVLSEDYVKVIEELKTLNEG